MPKAHYIQNVFNAGQLSPLMAARSDLSKYANGAENLTNFIPVVQGGLQRRPGTKFAAEVKDSSKATRLIEFEFSVTQAYILEFGDLYFRIYKDNGRVETGAFGPEFAAEFEHTDPVTVTTTYVADDLFQLKWAQSADILYIAHPSYPPRKVSRTSDISWSITTIDFQDGPYLLTNTTSTTLTLSGTSGSVTVTASSATGINDGSGFLSTDVGRLIRWQDPANNWTWLEITAVGSTTSATATIRGPNASAGTATTDWRLGVWSDTTGYPSCVTFFENRLYFGGGVDFPQRLDGSVIGDYENFAPTDADGTVTADKAVSFTLNANNVNVIHWILDDEKGLVVGTVGGEWLVRSDQQSDAISAENLPQARRTTTYGSDDQMPVRAGKAVLFVQRAKRKVREMAYVFQDDGFRAPDLTLLSDDITGSGVVEMAYQQEPQSIVWAVREDGTLLGLTYERDQEVIGWHKHIIGGVSDASGTQAKVESVAVIPSPTGTSDQLWMVVQRYVNGQTVRYVEYLTPIWTSGDAVTSAFFVDSGLTYSGDPATSILGLFHLEGETVSVLADGAAHPDRTVSDTFRITLERDASTVHVGLGYNSDLKTMRPDVGAADGTAQGKVKRINSVTFRFWDTVGFQTSPDGTTYTDLIFREGGQNMDTAVPLFTGDKKIDWPMKYELAGQIYVRQAQPLPCNLLAIMPRIVTQDD